MTWGMIVITLLSDAFSGTYLPISFGMIIVTAIPNQILWILQAGFPATSSNIYVVINGLSCLTSLTSLRVLAFENHIRA